MTALIEYFSVIAPGVVSVIGIVTAVLVALYELKQTINKFKNDKDKLIEELRASDSVYKAQMLTLIEQNRELAKVNKTLTDHLAKIKGYTDVKNKEI